MAKAKRGVRGGGRKVRRTGRGRRSGARGVRRMAPAGFPAVWMEIGRKLVRELKAERGWDQKSFLGCFRSDPALAGRILASAKGLLPRAAAAAVSHGAVPHAPAPRSAAPAPAALPAFNPQADDFWHTSIEAANSWEAPEE